MLTSEKVLIAVVATGLIVSGAVLIGKLPQATNLPPVPSVSQAGVASASPRFLSDQVSTSDLPDTASSFLANFYAAYQTNQRHRLETMFVPDSNQDLQALRDRTFADGAVWREVDAYRVVSAVSSGNGWLVTVAETGPSQSVTLLVRLVAAPTGKGVWLVDSYAPIGSAGKYDGFLIE